MTRSNGALFLVSLTAQPIDEVSRLSMASRPWFVPLFYRSNKGLFSPALMPFSSCQYSFPSKAKR